MCLFGSRIQKEEQCRFIIFVAVSMELIWAARNAKIFKGTVPIFEEIRLRRETLVNEHWRAQSKATKKKQGRDLWKRPPKGSLKMNLDVAVRSPSSMGACVNRNELGIILFVATWSLKTSNPAVAEAESMLCGILEAKKLGVAKMIFKGDALLTMAPLWTGGVNRTGV